MLKSANVIMLVVVGTIMSFTLLYAGESKTVHLKINGTIQNFKEFAACVVPETYIQLVPMPADESYSVATDDKGRVTFQSDLAKLPVPKKAAFTFDVSSIPPGRYAIAAQRLNAKWSNGQPPQPMFITTKNKLFIMDIPADAKSPFTIKAGDLIVWTKP